MKTSITEYIAQAKHDFEDEADMDELIHAAKDKKIGMMGEASHGTHEYYNWRARISRRLIAEHGFDFIAVEGDWPPCYRLNRYVKNYKDAGDITREALKAFERWPGWMWANWEIHEWADWLREYNSSLGADQRVGFYGLDVYSLWESLDAVMNYLEKEDPDALKTARKAMQCFEPHRGDDGQSYALSTRLVPEGCSKEVNDMLRKIRRKVPIYNSDKEHVFSTEQNALVAKNAEEYYRLMMQGGKSTWNLRDGHMADTLQRLLKFHGKDAKAIVWAHNTHIGDAAYTDMKGAGLYNIGQLAREHFGEENVFLMGFGAYSGSLIAGRAWGEEAENMVLPKAKENSWEAFCHGAGSQFYVLSKDLLPHPQLKQSIPHRAVGVVYSPDRERFGNYVPTVIPRRYDGFVFFDESRALHPIDIEIEEDKLPETYPFGL